MKITTDMITGIIMAYMSKHCIGFVKQDTELHRYIAEKLEEEKLATEEINKINVQIDIEKLESEHRIQSLKDKIKIIQGCCQHYSKTKSYDNNGGISTISCDVCGHISEWSMPPYAV